MGVGVGKNTQEIKMSPRIRARQKGLSLIEILVVLLILGILVKLLTPVLQSYIVRSNRSDAIKSLSAMQISQEKWRLNSTSYGTLAQVWTGTNSLGGFYTMTVPSNGTTNYTLTATAGTAQSSDTGCTAMTITYASGTSTQTPTTCWQ